MANFLSALGEANPVAIEKGFQDLAKGEVDLAAAKQTMQQSAEMHPLKKQAMEIEQNKAQIDLRKAQQEEEMGEKLVDVKMAFGPQFKDSPQTMNTMFKFYEDNGLIQYVPGPNGEIPTVKMKNLKYGMGLLEQDQKMQGMIVTSRMADVQNSLAQVQQAKIEASSGKKPDQQKLATLDAQEKALKAQWSGLLEAQAAYSGKSVDLAEKRMKDATDRRGQDLTYKANAARIGLEREKLTTDELNKAETRVAGLEGLKAKLIAGDKQDPMVAAIMGQSTDPNVQKAAVKQALGEIDTEIDTLYSRHKSLGTRKRSTNLRAYDQLNLGK